MKAFDDAELAEILAIFPELEKLATYQPLAYPQLKHREAKTVLEAL